MKTWILLPLLVNLLFMSFTFENPVPDSKDVCRHAEFSMPNLHTYSISHCMSYVCSFFSGPSDLILEIDGTTFSCRACGKSFKDKSNCRRHVKSTHFPEVAETCEICHKIFKNKNSLKCHIRAVHTDFKGYKEMQETTQIWMWREEGTGSWGTCLQLLHIWWKSSNKLELFPSRKMVWQNSL